MEYILVLLFIFFMNVAPAFMPPTWIVLSFFYLQFHLAFAPTILVGVIGATSGRIVLALLARRFGVKLLPKKMASNYESLGEAFKKRQQLTIPVVIAYAFSPISSNTLFIILGLAEVRLWLAAGSFFLGRLFSYSFWVGATYQVSKHLEDIFAGNFFRYQSLINLGITLLIIYIVGKIEWEKLLDKKKSK